MEQRTATPPKSLNEVLGYELDQSPVELLTALRESSAKNNSRPLEYVTEEFDQKKEEIESLIDSGIGVICPLDVVQDRLSRLIEQQSFFHESGISMEDDTFETELAITFGYWEDQLRELRQL
jgi:hypothetical protein